MSKITFFFKTWNAAFKSITKIAFEALLIFNLSHFLVTQGDIGKGFSHNGKAW